MKERHVLLAAEHVRLKRWCDAARLEKKPLRLNCADLMGHPAKSIELPDWIASKVLAMVLADAQDALDGYGVEKG